MRVGQRIVDDARISKSIQLGLLVVHLFGTVVFAVFIALYWDTLGAARWGMVELAIAVPIYSLILLMLLRRDHNNLAFGVGAALNLCVALLFTFSLGHTEFEPELVSMLVMSVVAFSVLAGAV